MMITPASAGLFQSAPSRSSPRLRCSPASYTFMFALRAPSAMRERSTSRLVLAGSARKASIVASLKSLRAAFRSAMCVVVLMCDTTLATGVVVRQPQFVVVLQQGLGLSLRACICTHHERAWASGPRNAQLPPKGSIQQQLQRRRYACYNSKDVDFCFGFPKRRITYQLKLLSQS